MASVSGADSAPVNVGSIEISRLRAELARMKGYGTRPPEKSDGVLRKACEAELRLRPAAPAGVADLNAIPSVQGWHPRLSRYDLRDLYIGAEGTLGVITGATLQLYPQLVASVTAWPRWYHRTRRCGCSGRR